MISTFLAAALAGAFQHPTPTPPADLPTSVYRERRDRLIKALHGCVGVIGSQGEVSGITEDYRQDADFYWLTGINEPGAFLVFAPKAPFNAVDRSAGTDLTRHGYSDRRIAQESIVITWLSGLN